MPYKIIKIECPKLVILLSPVRIKDFRGVLLELLYEPLIDIKFECGRHMRIWYRNWIISYVFPQRSTK